MWWEKAGTTHHGVSGKNFEQELVRLASKLQMPKFVRTGGGREEKNSGICPGANMFSGIKSVLIILDLASVVG